MYYLRFALSTSSAWQGKGSTSQFLGFNWLPRFYARMSGVVYWVSASNFPFDWVLSSSASAKIVSSLGSSLNLGSPLEKTGCRARLWSILLGHWTTAGGGTLHHDGVSQPQDPLWERRGQTDAEWEETDGGDKGSQRPSYLLDEASGCGKWGLKVSKKKWFEPNLLFFVSFWNTSNL